MNRPQNTASAATPAPTQKATLKLWSSAGAVVHVGEAGSPGDRLLNRQDRLNAGHLPDLGGQELRRAHDAVLRRRQLVGHGRRRRRVGDAHAEARQGQRHQDDHADPPTRLSVANRIMERSSDPAPKSVAVRSPVRTVI